MLRYKTAKHGMREIDSYYLLAYKLYRLAVEERHNTGSCTNDDPLNGSHPKTRCAMPMVEHMRKYMRNINGTIDATEFSLELLRYVNSL